MSNQWINNKTMKTFRKVVPYPIRLVIAVIFWLVAVVPVFVIYEMVLGAKYGWREAVNLWHWASVSGK